MAAHDATLAQALGCFEGEWRWLADELLDGRCALWLGSAISQDCFRNLGQLLRLALERLDAREEREAIARLIEIANAKRAKGGEDPIVVDPEEPLADWSDSARDAVIDALWYRYSAALGVTTKNGERVKDLLDLPTIYADESVEPDADHRLLAVLIEEGAVTEMVSGNWDELIERAHVACAPERSVRVIVRAIEMIEGVDDPSIFKFHGCARKALDDPDTYAPLMVATQDEIDEFRDGAAAAPIREALRTSIRQRPMLFVGLSGQDRDIQDTFRRAAKGLEGAFSEPDEAAGGPVPRLVVASDRVGCHQKGILATLHGEAFDADPDAFLSRAAVPLFSKPLFGALYVHALLEKARLSVRHPFPGTHVALLTGLASAALDELREVLCARFVEEAEDDAERWRRLAGEVPRAVTRLVALYRDQRWPATRQTYRSPWAGLPRRKLREAPYLVWGFAYDRLLAIFELLRRVDERSDAELRFLQADAPCHAVVAKGPIERRIFVLLPVTGRDLLVQRGALDDADDSDLVFVYAVGPRPAQQTRSLAKSRLPSRSRGNLDEPVEIWLDELLDRVDVDGAVDRLARELAA